jgi:hypothetical protein
MNPDLPGKVVQKALERDPSKARAEYLAEFRSDLESFVSVEAVEACVVPGRFELPYCGEFQYVAAVDPAGGGPDEFALSVCHLEEDQVVQDCIRGWHSRRPVDVVKETVQLLSSYHIQTVRGDRYSGEWVRQAFGDLGIQYLVTDLTASEAFLELLPTINQGTIDLLDNSRQTAQLIALERRKGRTGRETIGHPVGGSDDRANALAIASHVAIKEERCQLFFI